jgi:hypothetical protein
MYNTAIQFVFEKHNEYGNLYNKVLNIVKKQQYRGLSERVIE